LEEPSGGGVVEADSHEGEPAGGVGGPLLGAEAAVAACSDGGGVAGLPYSSVVPLAEVRVCALDLCLVRCHCWAALRFWGCSCAGS
jgi:hypothetical protein